MRSAAHEHGRIFGKSPVEGESRIERPLAGERDRFCLYEEKDSRERPAATDLPLLNALKLRVDTKQDTPGRQGADLEKPFCVGPDQGSVVGLKVPVSWGGGKGRGLATARRSC